MRKSGILLHPTSLPGKSGIGDLGSWAYRFADFLVESGFRLWQILPLSPVGSGFSPYQAYSSVACNPLLISLDALVAQEWLHQQDVAVQADFSAYSVDFEKVIPFKTRLVYKAAESFRNDPSHPLRRDFQAFCEQQKSWLDLFAEFAALKKLNSGRAWTDWTVKKVTDPAHILDEKFIQFEVFREWGRLKEYCNSRGIEIVGDLPIFVAHDSADVWANPELFDLDAEGKQKTMAGVPPDYFSATGQCWGSPLYNWDAMRRRGYRWWIDRIRIMRQQVDRIRIDHFRGFEKYWEIPAGSDTAVKGRWVDGPGLSFFKVLKEALGELPFIAEDLGYITPEVHALRDALGLPGMRVLQFAFGDESAENPHKPYNFVRNSVVYTATHDNNTTAGWFAGGDRTYASDEISRALRYLGVNAGDGVPGFIRALLGSVADTAVIPMQDLLGLGEEARMNTPSTVEGNWRWRMREEHLTPELSSHLHALNRTYGRI